MSQSPEAQKRRLHAAVLHFFVGSRYGAQVALTTLCFLATASFFIYQAFYQQYEQVMEIFQVVDPQMKQQLVVNDILVRNVALLVLAIVVYIVAMGVLIVRARHTYQGPLVAIEKFVSDITRGEYRHRIVIRKGDELQQLVLSLNQMAEQLELRHGITHDPHYDKTADH